MHVATHTYVRSQVALYHVRYVTTMLITQKAHANYMNRAHATQNAKRSRRLHNIQEHVLFDAKCLAFITKTQLHVSVFLFETLGAIFKKVIYTSSASSNEVGATELDTQQINVVTNVHSTKIALQMQLKHFQSQ